MKLKINKKYSKNILLISVFDSFLSMTFQRGIFILYLISLNISNSNIGVLQSILFFTIFFSEIPTGIIGDKLGRKNTLIIGVIFGLLSLGIMVFSKNYYIILVSFILEGIAIAFFSGTNSALFYDSLKQTGKEEKYLKYNGYISTFSNIIMGISIACGAFIQAISWRYVYISSLVAVLIGGIFICFIYENKQDYLEEIPKEEFSISNEILTFLKKRTSLYLLLFVVGTSIIEATSSYYYIICQSLFNTQNISIEVIGLIYGGLQIMTGLIYGLSIKVNEKYKLMNILFFSTLLSVISFSLILFNKSYVTLVVLLIITAISDIVYISKDNYIQKSIISSLRSSLLSVVSFTTSIIISIIYMIYGIIGDHYNPQLTMFFLIIPNILALVLLAIYFRNNNKINKGVLL